MKTYPELESVIVPAIEGLGYKFFGLNYINHNSGSLLRIFIDSTTGILAEDCQIVGQHLKSLIKVELSSLQDISLEISSPGVNRILFRREHYAEQLGKLVMVKLNQNNNCGRKKIKGKLHTVNEDAIEINEDGKILKVQFAEILQTRIVHNWTNK